MSLEAFLAEPFLIFFKAKVMGVEAAIVGVGCEESPFPMRRESLPHCKGIRGKLQDLVGNTNFRKIKSRHF